MDELFPPLRKLQSCMTERQRGIEGMRGVGERVNWLTRSEGPQVGTTCRRDAKKEKEARDVSAL